MVVGMQTPIPGRKTSHPRAIKHDFLCQQHPEHVEHTGGLQYCWCMCGDCWHGEGLTRPKRKPTLREREEGLDPPATQTRGKGRCICKECPCHELVPMAISIHTTFPEAIKHDPPQS